MRFPDLPTRGPAPMTGSAGALASVDAPDDDIPVRPTFFRDKKNDTNFKTLISTFAKVKEFTNWTYSRKLVTKSVKPWEDQPQRLSPRPWG